MKHLLLFFLISCTATMCSQPARELAFIEHLNLRNRHNEALQLLHFERSQFSPDTASYLIGQQHHFLKNTDSAVFYFRKVSDQDGFYAPSRYLGTLNLLYMKKYQEAEKFLSVVASQDTAQLELQKLMLGGNLLLQRDYQRFDSLSGTFGFNHYTSSAEQEYLKRLRVNMTKTRKKSPALAGLFSAVIPGSGKFYAGRKGAALAAFMSNLVLAGIAYEAFYRSGLKSPQFIIAGSVFGVFYTGNIVGSVYSVKQQQRSLNGKINNEILATIHIPVNRIFLR